jgi:long-chain acyl-CoA synthetase
MFEKIYENATFLKQKTAIVNGKYTLTYADLKRELDEKKEWYETVLKGKNVAVVAGNVWETALLILLGAQSHGRVILLGDNLRPNEFEYYVKNLQLDYVFISEEKRKEFEAKVVMTEEVLTYNRLKCLKCKRVEDATDTLYEDEDFVVQLTSGSEGVSKAASRSIESLKNEIIYTCKTADLSGDEVYMTIPPIAHSYGLVIGLLIPLYMGKQVILMENFIPDQVEKYLTDYKVNLFIAVPFMYHILCKRNSISKDKLFLNKCFSAGGALDASIVNKFNDLTGINIWNDYGSTETGLICLETSGKLNKVGKPIYGVDLKIRDSAGNNLGVNEQGVINVSSKSFGRGYVFPYSLTEKKFVDGYYITGDVGRVDTEGYASIEGRNDDFFIVGSEKTSAGEIKNALLTIDEISDAVVTSEKNPGIGDIIVAYIVRNGGSVITEMDVVKRCKTFMEEYKVPRKIHFIREIPKNKNGKVLRKYLASEVIG